MIQQSQSSPGHIFQQNSNSKRYMYPFIHSSTIYNRQDMETRWIHAGRWKDKEHVVCIHTRTHSGILLSHRRETMPPAAPCTDLEVTVRHRMVSPYGDIPRDVTVWPHTRVQSKTRHQWTCLGKRGRLRHRTDLQWPQGGVVGRDGSGGWDGQARTVICRLDTQRGPAGWLSELYLISCDKSQWKAIWKRIYIYMYEVKWSRSVVTLRTVALGLPWWLRG